MRRTVIVSIIVLNIFIIIPARMSLAQNFAADQRQKNYNPIVGEALDEVETVFEQSNAIEPNVGPDIVELNVEPFMAQDENIVEDIVQKEPQPVNIQETKIIPILHAEASSIIETLQEMKSPQGDVNFNEIDRTLILKDYPQQLEAMSNFVKEVDILLETEAFKLEFTEAKDVIDDVQSILTSNVGQAEVDERTNSIVVTDIPAKIKTIREQVEQLDQVNKKVQIDSKILQIVLNDEHITGVDWEAIVSDYQKLNFSGFTFAKEVTNSGQLNLGVVSNEDYAILLEALDTVGAVDTIADDSMEMENQQMQVVSVYSASVRDMENVKLRLDPKDDVYFPELNEETSDGEKVRFHLTPTINRGGTLTVAVNPELVPGDIASLNNEEKHNTKVQVDNGATIVIGSLFEEVMVESTWKIPLLGDLPLLGFVFRNQGEVSRKAEVITFLTVKTIEKEN